MPRLPDLRASLNACESPHLVLLGAGASRAACPDGDRNGRELPLMADLLDGLDLRDMIESAGIDTSSDNFELIYSTILKEGHRMKALRETVEQRTHAHFAALELPERVTLYDRLLLTLRKKDAIVTFNWDPLLLQAYARNGAAADLPNVVFLHGNVAVAICTECRVKGWIGARCERCGEALVPSKLLYPVAEKNYDADPFIAAEWAEFRSYVRNAYLFTIFGYSAPETDQTARRTILDTWNANPSRELAEVFLIDIADRSVLETKWREFFVRNHFGISESMEGSWQFQHPRRSCDAFAMATLQLQPCKTNPLPDFEDLRDLHEWIAPLVEEERAMYSEGTPLEC